MFGSFEIRVRSRNRTKLRYLLLVPAVSPTQPKVVAGNIYRPGERESAPNPANPRGDSESKKEIFCPSYYDQIS